jgi:hypothetical protein
VHLPSKPQENLETFSEILDGILDEKGEQSKISDISPPTYRYQKYN